MRLSRTTTGFALGVLHCVTLHAEAANPLDQFEKVVRPLLEQRCFECHGADKQKGGLRLDQKSAMLGSGDSEEPAVIPGKSAESLVIKRILTNDPDESMPPKGKRLSAEEIAVIKQWIDSGAHWPGSQETEPTIAVAKDKLITEADRAFWSFQPPRKTERAYSDRWIREPLDGMVLARMREKGLEPSPETSRATFIRRVTFDITGLPPTPEEVDSFAADQNPDAHRRLVDRLLASPRFGERLASTWLPLARFAEDQAHQVGSDTKFFYPNAYLYRGWVIEAFNRDLPYDRFLKLQLAADRMPDTPASELPALGFLGLGPKYYNRGRLEVMADEWEDRVDTVTRTMLGMTVACARCHDHKFDPITATDYHALAGVFASTKMVNRRPDGAGEKDSAEAGQMTATTLHVVEDDKPQDLNLFIRGNVTRKGPVVPRRFLTVLSPSEPPPFHEGSGRRELADAIASRNNPLTARVFVNRVWGLFFGQPLVSTPSNFGHSGSKPANQELLDDLAVRFMEHGWSIKTLVKEIALSATYRQTADVDPAKAAKDPGNDLLSHMNRRRLSVEQWRDAVLSVSGELLEAPGARSEDLDDPTNTMRTLYARVSRLKLNDLLMQFDYPDANVHAEKRSVTTTPMQKLFVLNSAFMQRRAAALSARMSQLEGPDDLRITTIYRLLLGRTPDETELSLALDFLNKGSDSEMTRWERYAQLLLASNEMLYVD
jgi:mono/diheme cytochrome c family protein